MWNLTYGTNGLVYEIGTDSQTQRTDLWLPSWRQVGGGMDGEFGINKCRYIYIYKQIYVYVGITESLCCTPDTNTPL